MTEVGLSKDADLKNAKTLIAIFSKTGENYSVGIVNKGNTMMVAENIQKLIPKAKIFEIVPEIKYPDNYDAAVNLATKEFKEGAKPKIKNKISDFSDYKVVFIGYPIWWSKYPQIVKVFLASYDFSGKVVIPFCTHEGSGEAGSFSAMQRDLPDAKVLSGLALYGHEARESESINKIRSWLSNLGFIK